MYRSFMMMARAFFIAQRDFPAVNYLVSLLIAAFLLAPLVGALLLMQSPVHYWVISVICLAGIALVSLVLDDAIVKALAKYQFAARIADLHPFDEKQLYSWLLGEPTFVDGPSYLADSPPAFKSLQLFFVKEPFGRVAADVLRQRSLIGRKMYLTSVIKFAEKLAMKVKNPEGW